MKNSAWVRFRFVAALGAIAVLLVFANDRDVQAGEKERAGYLLTSKAFRAATAKVLPSIVTIETYGASTRPKSSGRRRRRSSGGISRPGDGPTTGVIVSPDGYIATSTFNFAANPRIITVILRDGSRHVAKLLGRDETRKICVLKIEGQSDLPVPKMVARSELKVGQWAISVGVGYGDVEPAISYGIISATSRISGKAVQTDANISPANYGGPLLDIEGRMIGLCTPLSPRSKEVTAGVAWYDSGIGFAVPLHGAERLLAIMKQGKVVHPGRIGIIPKPASPQGGVAIATVAPGTPAQKANLKKDDIIVSVDGEKIADVLHLRVVLGRYVAGDKIKLKIKSGDKQRDVELTLTKGVEPTKKPPGRKLPGKPKPKKKPAAS
ncbi:MAG: trypsin-like peptidase domain-containing protein [Planctomycetes bacterium]|nr:trypsin-like peptidase domain-containing protein [Planctomycetota bacterium]